MDASRSIRPARFLAALAFVLAGSGCLGANEHEATQFPPLIRSFAANPTSLPSGGVTTLTWTVQGATSVAITPGIGTVTGNAISVRPGATTTFTLTATSAGGTSTATVTVTVAPPAPAGLAYATNPATYTVGTAITPNTPSSTGGAIAGYAVSPTLPAGLALDTTTGILSGTPTAVSATATYTVTGTNATGSTTASLTLTVVAPSPPTIVSFQAAPSAITAGEASVLSWDVLGATLLTIDNGVGAVVGTSTTVHPTTTTTYRLTATNAGGSVFATATVTVGTGPPANLRYANATYVVGSAIAPNTPTSTGGAILSYTVAPPLPAGLAIDATTGVISGTPTAVTPSATYVVTGTNASGSTTANVVIAVVAQPGPGFPVIRAFTASPSTVVDGSATILSWDVLDATSLTIDPFIGTVTGTQIEFSPTVTTTFTLSAQNATGTTTANVTVTVTYLPPANLAYATNPAIYTVGTAITPNVPSSSGGVVFSYELDRSLPAGLSLDATTGVISGTPTAATAQATYTVTARNPSGTASVPLVVTVVLPTLSITRQPTDASALPPGTATFSVEATGLAPLAYQWRKNGQAVTGATAASYTTPALVLADDGSVYDVVVTDAASRSVTSVGALLTLRGFFATGSMVTARAGHTATLLTASGKVLVTGGNGGSGSLASAELYDPATGTFTATGSMAVAREGHAAVELPGGKVLVAGGCTGNATGCTTYLSSAELYDPTTGAFTATGSLTGPRMDFAAALLDGKVLVTGGFFHATQAPTENYLATAERYDPATGIFTATGSMPAASRYPMAAALLDGTLLVTGGAGATGVVSTSSTFDPFFGAFAATGALATAREWGTATTLAGGEVLVAGGFATSFLASAERYSTGTARFAATGALTTARALHTATLLGTGEVLVAGGAGAGATAEIYDPVSGTFGPAPSMATARARQTATRLLDGRVLVAGGAGNAGMLSSAELWAPAQ